MQTIEEYKEYTRQLEGEVKKWHDAFDASELMNRNLVADKDAETRKLKRALWLTRAERAETEHAHWATIWFCNTKIDLNINKSSVSQDPYKSNTFKNASEWRNMWYDIASKCRAKAEEYK